MKTAFIAILGCPNVGKSSILNHLLGEKVAIVSPKPQTTRTRLMGVWTEGERQMVFTDTPGVHRPRTKLGEHMMQAVKSGMDGVDACLFVTEADGKEPRPEERDLLRELQLAGVPVILALNKMDLLLRKDSLARRILQFSQPYDFAAVVPCSAKTGAQMDELRAELQALFDQLPLDEGFFFPEDTLTDQPERVLAAELLREQLLRRMEQEIPHGTAVVIEKMREHPNKAGLLDIEATIFCERESHKGMIIGKQGAALKQIAAAARLEMERFFGCRVNLQCWVKVKENWRDREGLIRNFGLE
ncbi:MAG: GTPase Era [Oscillospiraceae bacterium]|jgi:GTP-binding protein Era|nr:GTPase Era [Oscillospiraceae bacterium]